MKIAGAMSIWNDEIWAPYCLKQASEVCDVVFVVEGGHSTQFEERSDDSTREIVKKAAEEYGNVHMLTLPFTRSENDITSQRYDTYQCAVWSYLVQTARKETDCEWFRFWDSDMYFFDKDIQRIIEFMHVTQAPCLSFRERRFIYNFRFSTEDTTGYFYRVTPASYVTPISKMHFADGELYSNFAVEIPEVVCHHYSGVRTPERMEQRFLLSREKGTPFALQHWRDWRDMEWKDDEDFMEKFPALADAILGGENPQVYDGPHPECLDGHPWAEVDDVRKL